MFSKNTFSTPSSYGDTTAFNINAMCKSDLLLVLTISSEMEMRQMKNSISLTIVYAPIILAANDTPMQHTL